MNLITDKGAHLITVSPEIERSVEKSIQQSNATFEIISDKNYEIMNLYGVTFKIEEPTLKKYKLFGIDLEEANGNNENILPVPATYIINQNGTVDYIHFDKNYKNRLSVAEIVKQFQSILSNLLYLLYQIQQRCNHISNNNSQLQSQKQRKN